MHTLTVTPFMVALVLGLVQMPLPIFKVAAWNVGIVKADPWRLRAERAVASAAFSFAWLQRLFRCRGAMIVASVAMALLAVHLGVAQGEAATLAAGGAIAGLTEPTLAEVKDAIEASNRAFGEFRAANDLRLKQIEEKGSADPLLSTKLDNIEVDFKKYDDVIKAFEARMNRIEKSGALRTDGDAIEVKEYRSALFGYLRKGDSAGLRDLEAKATSMSVGSDPDGGYTVIADTSGRLVKRAFDSSPIRQIASVQTIGTDRLEGFRDTDEADAEWVTESGTRNDTNTPQIGKWEIPVHELQAKPKVTQKLLDDSSWDIERWLADKVFAKFGRKEATAFVTGNGVGKARGFASYSTAATVDASRAWGVMEHVATAANGSFGTSPNGSDKLIDLVAALNPAYRQNARFVMPRLTLAAVRKLKVNNEYVWLPTVTPGASGTILGYAITEAEDMAAYTTTDALGIAFGDFMQGYQIVDHKVGVRTLRDPYTAKPYIVMYSTKRVGGDVIDFNAIKFMKFGS